jgi:hypothetical protein
VREPTNGCLAPSPSPRLRSCLADIRERKVKPGFVTLRACMQACYERGLREFNPLPEATAYKLELSNAERSLTSAVAGRRRPKLLVLNGSRTLKGRMRSSGEHTAA